MKKLMRTIMVFMLLGLILASCTNSRKNELIYRFEESDKAVPFDSLKSEILGASGADMLMVYPDSDLVIIHYDRFKTNQDIIEKHFKDCGYTIVLLEKKRIQEKDQPWQKK
jgi:hypothetical protein